MKFWRHSIRILISGLIIFVLVISDTSAQISGPKTVFWKISGNGLENPSWLFGTIHIMPKEEFRSFPIVDKMLKESGQMVLEMAIDVPLKQQIEWARQMLLPEGTTIRDYLSDEEFSHLREFVIDTLGVKETNFNNYLRLKPFAFYSALIPSVIGKKIEGYELYFSKLAKKKDIPVKELENFEFQMGIFDSIPNDEQMAMFFGEEQDMRKELSETLEIYQDQDIYRMSLNVENDSLSGNFEIQLIERRNRNWIPKLENFMKQKSSFIAVGAGHLAGEHGLIGMLRDRGYLVEPVILKEEK
jgi:uncharacterized protein YbaP (TraB family)